MSYPDLPIAVKMMLADERHRMHHHLWHFVRNRDNWYRLSTEDRDALTNEGWAAPRFDEEPGSGIDFLGMHRQMIAMTDSALAGANDPNWPRVIAWDPIPWTDDDSEWSVPTWQETAPPWASEQQWQTFTDLAIGARSQSQVATMRRLAERFRDPSFLNTISLDELGIAMEWSIHGWMHMRWSGAPHDDEFSADMNNDWLFVPWSSHVNKAFWKLHGWIDARIADWKDANDDGADLSGAWAGPVGVPGAMSHMADIRLLDRLPPRDELPLPMQVRQHIVEGLLR